MEIESFPVELTMEFSTDVGALDFTKSSPVLLSMTLSSDVELSTELTVPVTMYEMEYV